MCRKLIAVDDGTEDLIPAIADYEQQMCGYAAKALGNAEKLFESFDEMRRAQQC